MDLLEADYTGIMVAAIGLISVCMIWILLQLQRVNKQISKKCDDLGVDIDAPEPMCDGYQPRVAGHNPPPPKGLIRPDPPPSPPPSPPPLEKDIQWLEPTTYPEVEKLRKENRRLRNLLWGSQLPEFRRTPKSEPRPKGPETEIIRPYTTKTPLKEGKHEPTEKD